LPKCVAISLYKRFDDSSYSKDVKFGIVKSVYNDGEKTYVEAVEYKKSYKDPEASIYIIRGDNDVSIFPASLEETPTSLEMLLRESSARFPTSRKKYVNLSPHLRPLASS
jgi:hypothetical protein